MRYAKVSVCDLGLVSSKELNNEDFNRNAFTLEELREKIIKNKYFTEHILSHTAYKENI